MAIAIVSVQPTDTRANPTYATATATITITPASQDRTLLPSDLC